VLTRWLGFAGDLAVAAEERALWKAAEALLPPSDVDRYTQGLMDLGATVCASRRPLCAACPLAADCVAHRQGQPEAYPVKTRKLQRGRRRHALLWLVHRDRLWLTQRPATGVWAGLWSLPEFDDLAALHARLAGWPGSSELLPVVEHALTHFDWTLQPLRWTLPSRLGPARLAALEAQLPPGRWVDAATALAMGLPAPLRKLLADA
jgi:A/G-specific adenine glycosylase